MKKNPIVRNLIVTVFMSLGIFLLGIVALYGGRLVETIMQSSFYKPLTWLAVVFVSAIIFGIVEIVASNKKYSDD